MTQAGEPGVRRGDIWWLDWSLGRGSEQGGRRPALVIQNDIGNLHSPTTIVAAVGTQGRPFPFIVALSASESGLARETFANLAQILTVDKSKLLTKAGQVGAERMEEVDRAIAVSLGLEAV
ncbi:MAG: type II toxin-antitoxin system PemK/MazF family toxin [Dehalococcoidia bacterium]